MLEERNSCFGWPLVLVSSAEFMPTLGSAASLDGLLPVKCLLMWLLETAEVREWVRSSRIIRLIAKGWRRHN
jgi:hypothetical protein